MTTRPGLHRGTQSSTHTLLSAVQTGWGHSSSKGVHNRGKMLARQRGGGTRGPLFMRSGDFEKYQSLQTSPVELRWESLLKGLTLSCFPKQGTRGDEWMCFCIRHRNLRAYREERAPDSSAVMLFNATCPHQPGTQGACGERSHRGAEQEKGPHCRFPRSTTVLPNPWDMVPAVPWSCCPTVPSHPYVKR